ncbi:MAG: copper amine oxidase N-terminal domain-containing protein [Firmicutes bacterium]|nr:copper amine oxidase N-terminal domain-containing protein [Bacillota bacterium]
MKLSKFTALTLSVVTLFTTCVWANSENYVSKNQSVKDGASLARANIIIRPEDEVETGDSIIITFKNAKVFSQAVIDGTTSDSTLKGYKSGGYQYKYDGDIWNKRHGFNEIKDELDGNELPYRIQRTGDHEIEVFLCDLPDAYTDDKYHYEIPIVAYADVNTATGRTITATIDSNGTSISSGNAMGNGTTAGGKEEEEESSSSKKSSSSSSSSDSSTEATTKTPVSNVSVETNTGNGTQKQSTYVRVQIGASQLKVNATAYDIDVPAYIQLESQSTMVPLRAVTAALSGMAGSYQNADSIVSWDAETKTVNINYKGKKISFTSGSEYMTVNGERTLMPNGVKTEIVEGRTFVPFRALGNALGVSVDWEAETKTAVFVS